MDKSINSGTPACEALQSGSFLVVISDNLNEKSFLFVLGHCATALL